MPDHILSLPYGKGKRGLASLGAKEDNKTRCALMLLSLQKSHTIAKSREGINSPQKPRKRNRRRIWGKFGY